MGQNFEMLRKSSALFLLKMKDQHKVSQHAVDDIVFHSRSLFDDCITRVKVGIHSKLANNGINFDEIPGLQDVFAGLRDPFQDIDTCFKQEKYYRECLGLIVSLKKVIYFFFKSSSI